MIGEDAIQPVMAPRRQRSRMGSDVSDREGESSRPVEPGAQEEDARRRAERADWTGIHLDRRPLLGALVTVGWAGLAGCLGSGDDGSETDDDVDASDDDSGAEDADKGSDGDPYLREELRNAIENLDSPDPGTGVVAFENDGEYRTDDVQCERDVEAPDDPERGTAGGSFEFEDGEAFGVELSRTDDFDAIRNTITLTVVDPEGDGSEEIAIPRSLSPIKPEEGAEGSSAYVLREGETWYGGIGFDPSNRDLDFGETWVAITCDEEGEDA